MKSQYLHYFVHKNKVHIKSVRSGKVSYEVISDYTPPIFVPATRESRVDGHTIYGAPLTSANQAGDSVWETKKKVEEFDSSNFPVYGYSKIANSYVYSRFKGQEVDYDLVHTHYTDIETECEGGFPDPLLAEERINIIGTYSSRSSRYHIFYLYDQDISGHFEDSEFDDVVLHQCPDEQTLLQRYLDFHTSDYPDIWTGWNFEGFDIVYIYNRMNKVIGRELTSRLSPFKLVSHREFKDENGQDRVAIEINGISIVDYMIIYKKFVKKPRANYKLDTIGKAEVGETKLKHHSGIPGHLLYRKYFADGVKYNIQDVKLLVKMESKIRLIYNTKVMSYYSFTNFEDITSNMRILDMICYMFLVDQGKYFTWKYSAPPKVEYAGAAVKETIPGKYRWVASFDVTSEYPSLIRSQNISPETMTDLRYRIGPADILNKTFDNSEIIRKDLTVTGNGTTYRRDTPGFMPDIIRWLFEERQKYKRLKVEADKVHNVELANKHDLYQLAVKLCLNSLYGVTGTRFFRFYDIKIAEAITLSGQAMIGWVIQDVNLALQRLLGDTKDRVIASDTDSIYVNLEDVVTKKFGSSYDDEEVLAWVTRFCDENMNTLIEKSIEKFWIYLNGVDKTALDMKREVVSDDAIFIAKKRYIMSVRDKEGAKYDRGDEIKIIGVQAIQGSTPEPVREAMNDIFKVLLFSGKDEFYRTHNEFRDKFYKLAPDEICHNKGVNGIAKYQDHTGQPIKGTPINSRAAIVYNKLIEDLRITEVNPRVVEGEKIRYIDLKPGNPLRTTVLGRATEFPKEFDPYKQYIDYETLFDKQFSLPIHDLAKICGIRKETTTMENPFL